MNGNNDTATEILSVEEAWIADWAAEGIAALERHLAKQAAFQDYLDDRDLHSVDSHDGDRRTRA
jgi:type IV secretory pathway VirD2 relaxase